MDEGESELFFFRLFDLVWSLAELLLEIDTLEAENKTYPRLTAELGHETGGVIESRF